MYPQLVTYALMENVTKYPEIICQETNRLFLREEFIKRLNQKILHFLQVLENAETKMTQKCLPKESELQHDLDKEKAYSFDQMASQELRGVTEFYNVRCKSCTNVAYDLANFLLNKLR